MNSLLLQRISLGERMKRNQSTKYFRNKIRHKVVPVLEELNPNLSATFNTHLKYLQKEQQVLTQHLDTVKQEVCIFDERLKIDIQKLLNYDNIDVYLRHILNTYNFTEWHNIADLCTAQSGKFVQSETHRLIKDRDYLLLEENKVHLQDVKIEIEKGVNAINVQFNYNLQMFQEYRKRLKNSIYVDTDSVRFPLCLRKKDRWRCIFSVWNEREEETK